MTAVFIAIFLVMGVMIYFIAVSLRIVIENATKRVNAYFLSKLGEYDEDFEKKIEEMEELEDQRESLKQEIRILQMDHNSLEASRFYRPRPLMRDTYIPIARYIDNGFFEDYKKAKNLLVMDKAQIIRDIMEKFPYTGNLKRYQTAKKILDKLNFQAIYDLSGLTEDVQLEVLEEVFTKPEKLLLKEYRDESEDKEHFDLLEFLNWVKQILHRESPRLLASVGDENEDYSDISENVVCKFDQNVCEGIRIVYQNKLYDYSIYESRRKNERIY